MASREKRPGKNATYISQTSGGGGEGLISKLTGASNVKVAKRDEEINPYTDNERKLRAAGIEIPTYEKPGFWQNLISGGRANENTTAANQRNQELKNAMLNDMLTQETRGNQDATLEQLRHGNAMSANAKQAEEARRNAQEAGNNKVLNDRAILANLKNLGRYDTEQTPLAFDASTAKFGADTSRSNLLEAQDSMRTRLMDNEPEQFQNAIRAEAAQQGISNEAARGQEYRNAARFPLAQREEQFKESLQPINRRALEANTIAQEQRNKVPFFGQGFGFYPDGSVRNFSPAMTTYQQSPDQVIGGMTIPGRQIRVFRPATIGSNLDGDSIINDVDVDPKTGKIRKPAKVPLSDQFGE